MKKLAIILFLAVCYCPYQVLQSLQPVAQVLSIQVPTSMTRLITTWCQVVCELLPGLSLDQLYAL